jgi:hypothetical protein
MPQWHHARLAADYRPAACNQAAKEGLPATPQVVTMLRSVNGLGDLMIRVRQSRFRRLGGAAVVALALLGAPLSARAQDEEKPFREPGIIFMDERKAYIEWIAGSLIGLVCLLVAFKNPRRSHLD